MSFNVNFGGVNYDGALSYNGQRVLQAMKENVDNVDLICLQETHVGWEIAVSNSTTLSTQYPNQVWDHSKTNVYLASGTGVMAKANLNLDVEMLSSNVEGSYFDAMHIIVTRKNSKLEDSFNYQVLNLHLRPPLSFEGGNLQHISAFLYQTVSEISTKQVNLEYSNLTMPPSSKK
ncbi:predicted protein [Naegleria gruberi]|uniref:Predicted protein n=1 Tax=Naegleria gruberi TaxID=5762 RepID=D2W4D1_NAEGR|nr:uncharacterized protein NAEGRDRAFT_76263 [Naegleria gruberi]EFC36070.1 predicted protein [Naegleria gruberi]|eukprot:XP_002668814.1 predicted protein [Naegleria gruberi strain NEG-M]